MDYSPIGQGVVIPSRVKVVAWYLSECKPRLELALCHKMTDTPFMVLTLQDGINNTLYALAGHADIDGPIDDSRDRLCTGVKSWRFARP